MHPFLIHTESTRPRNVFSPRTRNFIPGYDISRTTTKAHRADREARFLSLDDFQENRVSQDFLS